jgi:drug/metabolite transporter (DMT)-like permease
MLEHVLTANHTDSLLYLPLADATVITFLSPALAGYACYLLFKEPFTRIEQIASMVSLLGVILIARPTSFFHLGNSNSGPHSPPGAPNITSTVADHGYHFPTPTSAQRLSAIAISLLGVAGSACVFTTLRWIGHRAHPLISVNYFAIWCTLVSFAALSIGSHIPPPLGSADLHLAFPVSLKQWGMLFFLGTCGFIMQFMMTAGLSHEKSNRATNMVYTNMLFALLFDRWVFGTVPGVWSLLGSGLILGSAIYVALQKGLAGDGRGVGREVEVGLLSDEDTAMLGDVDGFGDDEGDGEGQSVPLMEINVRDHDEERGQSVADGENNHQL